MEGGSFEECDAAKPRKNVMQLIQILNAQNKVHIEKESVLQLNCQVRVLGGTAQNRLWVYFSTQR